MPTITLKTTSASYPIHISSIAPFGEGYLKTLIITNKTIANLYLDSIIKQCRSKEIFTCILPDGEEHKTLSSIEKILEAGFSNRLDRKSLMVGLGGGVISDMVGFASGIYERGIDFISIPTTLLAQVDASVGGKCGVNNAFGKNLIGLFNQPKSVLIDTNFLKTLHKREINAGIAEMIKMAICFDRDEFFALKKANLYDLSTLNAHIQKAISIKAMVVQSDEKERGIRAALNYGHTFAHVIENITGYKKFLHGEAVGIGMIMANKLAKNLGLLSSKEYEQIKEILATYKLDLDFHISDIESFYQQFFLDKKSSQGNLTFVLPNGIGDVKILDNIKKSEIISVLESYK